MPQSQYRNVKRLLLNRHGSGPFCQFPIPSDLPFEGVYLIDVDGEIVYVGECLNLKFKSREGTL